MTIEHQKQVADKILDDLFLIDPYAIVAGGAPRDWHFNEEASDIDVFFHIGRAITTGMVNKMLSRILPAYIKCISEDDLPVSYEKNSALRCVRSYTIEGVNVQLIELHTPCWKIVDTFPVNMCKAWYKNEKITLERDFILGEKTKLLYMTNELYGRKDKYVEKINHKFVDGKGYNWCRGPQQAEGILLSSVLRQG